MRVFIIIYISFLFLGKLSSQIVNTHNRIETINIVASKNIETTPIKIDSSSIRQEVYSLKTQYDHIKFWKQVYESDQGHRGVATNDSIDISNLLKCSYYLNKFGYPDRKQLGDNSQILKLVWIHNKFPEVDLHTFPLIMEGFKSGQIAKSDLRKYYLNGSIKRTESEKDISQMNLSEILNKLKPQTKRPININTLLNLIEKENRFLAEKHDVIGIWYATTTYDTISLNNKPIIREFTKSPIKIFKSMEGNFYFHEMHEDRSHYPQRLTEMEKPNTFKLFEKDISYFEITADGDLKVVNINGSVDIYDKALN